MKPDPTSMEKSIKKWVDVLPEGNNVYRFQFPCALNLNGFIRAERGRAFIVFGQVEGDQYSDEYVCRYDKMLEFIQGVYN